MNSMRFSVILTTLSVVVALLSTATAQDRSGSPFPVDRVKEVQFSGGVAGASSFHPANDWRPENAFTRQRAVDSGGWSGGPSDSRSYNLPLSVWYDFKSRSVRAAEVSFQPGQSDPKFVNSAPSSYQFIGSNSEVCDDNAIWTVLCEDLSDQPWRNHWEVRYCRVKPEITRKFRCLGIKALKNHRKDGYTNLRNVRMWERVEAELKDEL